MLPLPSFVLSFNDSVKHLVTFFLKWYLQSILVIALIIVCNSVVVTPFGLEY